MCDYAHAGAMEGDRLKTCREVLRRLKTVAKKRRNVETIRVLSAAAMFVAPTNRMCMRCVTCEPMRGNTTHTQWAHVTRTCYNDSKNCRVSIQYLPIGYEGGLLKLPDKGTGPISSVVLPVVHQWQIYTIISIFHHTLRFAKDLPLPRCRPHSTCPQVPQSLPRHPDPPSSFQ